MQQRQRNLDMDELGLFSRKLNNRMAELNLTLRTFAIRLGITSEHGRRIARGLTIPTAPLLKLICAELGMDHEQMDRLARAENVRRKYGQVVLEMAGQKSKPRTYRDRLGRIDSGA